MLALFFLAMLAVAAKGSCPNACSGHGTCGLSSTCTCQARWVGRDCSQRECPYGLSWLAAGSGATIPAGGTLGGYHAYAECSDRGNCDRDSGECQCFDGYSGRGCRRSSCPNACSGHGYCRYNYEVNSAYKGYDDANAASATLRNDNTQSSKINFGTQTWDARKTRQCVCDRGYEGIDCASRICPKGDDPLTTCSEAATPGSSVNDIQTIEFPTGGTYGAAKFFSITFTDMFNGVYTTRPIDTNFGADNAAHKTYSASVKAALEELPNYAIPNVTVSTETCACGASCAVSTRAAGDGGPVCQAGHGNQSVVVAITFSDAANSGRQNDITVGSGSSHDSAPMQPRFDGNFGATPSVGRTDPTSPNRLEEHVECSNRGICDGDSGVCNCFEGFTGEACHQQTVFF